MLNQIFNEDCLEGMKRIPDGSIDCIITDPPYWTTACKWDTVIPFDLMWEQLKRIIKPNGAIVLFWSEPFSSALRMSNIKQYKYDWIWEKSIPSGSLTYKFMPMKRHEIISIFVNIWKPTFNGIKEKRSENTHLFDKWERRYKIDSPHNTSKEIILKNQSVLRNPTTILNIPNVSRHKQIHPTQKPVALIEYLIKTYTNEWETVLDFTAWSFTTAVASENTGRKWICIEKDEWYFNIWVDRVSKVVVQE